MEIIFIIIEALTFFFRDTPVINFQGEFISDTHSSICFMCDNVGCKDCRHKVVFKEKGYLWGQYGDIVGTYDDTAYVSDAKNIGIDI